MKFLPSKDSFKNNECWWIQNDMMSDNHDRRRTTNDVKNIHKKPKKWIRSFSADSQIFLKKGMKLLWKVPKTVGLSFLLNFLE